MSACRWSSATGGVERIVEIELNDDEQGRCSRSRSLGDGLIEACKAIARPKRPIAAGTLALHVPVRLPCHAIVRGQRR